MKKASHSRLEVYGVVSRIIGRDLTKEEHEELRAIMVEYVENQVAPYKVDVEPLRRRLKACGRGLYNILNKRGVIPEEIAFLKKVFEDTEVK